MTNIKTATELNNEITRQAFINRRLSKDELAAVLETTYRELDEGSADLGTVANVISLAAGQLAERRPGKKRDAKKWLAQFLNKKDVRPICHYYIVKDGYVYACNGHVSARSPRDAQRFPIDGFYNVNGAQVEPSADMVRARDGVIAYWKRFDHDKSNGLYHRASFDLATIGIAGRVGKFNSAIMVPDGEAPATTVPNLANIRYILQALNTDRGPVLIPRDDGGPVSSTPLYTICEHGECLIMPTRHP